MNSLRKVLYTIVLTLSSFTLNSAALAQEARVYSNSSSIYKADLLQLKSDASHIFVQNLIKTLSTKNLHLTIGRRIHPNEDHSQITKTHIITIKTKEHNEPFIIHIRYQQEQGIESMKEVVLKDWGRDKIYETELNKRISSPFGKLKILEENDIKVNLNTVMRDLRRPDITADKVATMLFAELMLKINQQAEVDFFSHQSLQYAQDNFLPISQKMKIKRNQRKVIKYMFYFGLTFSMLPLAFSPELADLLHLSQQNMQSILKSTATAAIAITGGLLFYESTLFKFYNKSLIETQKFLKSINFNKSSQNLYYLNERLNKFYLLKARVCSHVFQ